MAISQKDSRRTTATHLPWTIFYKRLTFFFLISRTKLPWTRLLRFVIIRRGTVKDDSSFRTLKIIITFVLVTNKLPHNEQPNLVDFTYVFFRSMILFSTSSFRCLRNCLKRFPKYIPSVIAVIDNDDWSVTKRRFTIPYGISYSLFWKEQLTNLILQPELMIFHWTWISFPVLLSLL